MGRLKEKMLAILKAQNTPAASVTDEVGRADSADTVKNDSVQNTAANVADHTAQIDSAGLAIEHDKVAAACVSKEKPIDEIPQIKLSTDSNLRHTQIFKFAYWLKGKGKTQIETVEILVKNGVSDFAAEEFADDVFRLPNERKISIDGVKKYRPVEPYRRIKNFDDSRSIFFKG